MSKDAYLDKMVATFVGIITNYFSQALAEVVVSTTNAIAATNKNDSKFQSKQRKAIEAMGSFMDLKIENFIEDLKKDLETVIGRATGDLKVTQMTDYIDSLNERLEKTGFNVNIDKGENGFMYGILDAICLGDFDEKELAKVAKANPTKDGAPRPMPAVIMDELLARIFPTPEEPAATEAQIQTLDDFLKGKGVKLA